MRGRTLAPWSPGPGPDRSVPGAGLDGSAPAFGLSLAIVAVALATLRTCAGRRRAGDESWLGSPRALVLEHPG